MSYGGRVGLNSIGVLGRASYGRIRRVGSAAPTRYVGAMPASLRANIDSIRASLLRSSVTATRYWNHASSAERFRIGMVLGLTVAVVVHQCVLWNWYVEDSPISFSYARNLIRGEGLVASPGAERVEGYS